MTTPSHHYLEGNFGPVHEEITAVDLPVTGTIPAELDGRLLRNGPNPIGAQDPATYHWFTGDGMVHGAAAARRRGRVVPQPVGAQPRGRRRARRAGPAVAVPGRRADLRGQHQRGRASPGTTFAIVEAGAPPIELTDELETVGPSNFSGTLEHPFSAHPKRRPA